MTDTRTRRRVEDTRRRAARGGDRDAARRERARPRDESARGERETETPTPFDRAASATPAAVGEAGGKYAFKTQSISNTPRSHIRDTQAADRRDVEYVAAPQGKIGRAFAHYHARPLLDARHR